MDSEEQNVFYEEYAPQEPTAEEKKPPEEHEKAIVLDEEKYGIGKPRRIVIRGRVMQK